MRHFISMAILLWAFYVFYAFIVPISARAAVDTKPAKATQPAVRAKKDKKICPVCKKNGMKSTVKGGVANCPAIYREPGHYDEDGEWLSGDWEEDTVPPLPCEYNYTCSKGHYWTETK